MNGEGHVESRAMYEIQHERKVKAGGVVEAASHLHVWCRELATTVQRDASSLCDFHHDWTSPAHTRDSPSDSVHMVVARLKRHYQTASEM